MALGWIGATTAFGSVVRKPKESTVASPSAFFWTLVQVVQMPAKTASGRPCPEGGPAVLKPKDALVLKQLGHLTGQP